MSEDYVRDHDGGVDVSKVVDPATFMTIFVFRTRGGHRWNEEVDTDNPTHCHGENELRWSAIREELWRHCLPKKK